MGGVSLGVAFRSCHTVCAAGVHKHNMQCRGNIVTAIDNKAGEVVKQVHVCLVIISSGTLPDVCHQGSSLFPGLDLLECSYHLHSEIMVEVQV